MLQLIEELRQIVPPPIDGFFFSNSGAEALEGAVKLARVATGRQNVIVFSRILPWPHGRDDGADDIQDHLSGWIRTAAFRASSWRRSPMRCGSA